MTDYIEVWVYEDVPRYNLTEKIYSVITWGTQLVRRMCRKVL